MILINRYEIEKESKRAAHRTVGEVVGIRNRNAATNPEIASDKMNDNPLDPVGILTLIKFIAHSFYCRNVIVPYFFTHFSDVHVNCSC